MRLLCGAGMNPTEAIRAATSGSATLLGVEARIGCIAPGMAADLVLVDRDPADDVGALETPIAVVKDGVVVHLADRGVQGEQGGET